MTLLDTSVLLWTLSLRPALGGRARSRRFRRRGAEVGAPLRFARVGEVRVGIVRVV